MRQRACPPLPSSGGRVPGTARPIAAQAFLARGFFLTNGTDRQMPHLSLCRHLQKRLIPLFSPNRAYPRRPILGYKRCRTISQDYGRNIYPIQTMACNTCNPCMACSGCQSSVLRHYPRTPALRRPKERAGRMFVNCPANVPSRSANSVYRYSALALSPMAFCQSALYKRRHGANPHN